MKDSHFPFLFLWLSVTCLWSCAPDAQLPTFPYLDHSKNILDYTISPQVPFDKSGLMFSDQGAWFAYGLTDAALPGFSGPFLMTQQNGVWASESLAYLEIKDQNWTALKTTSYSSHLEQQFVSGDLMLQQKLVYLSAATALIQSAITNTGENLVELQYQWKSSPLFADSLHLTQEGAFVKIDSDNTTATGYLYFPEDNLDCSDTAFHTHTKSVSIEPKGSLFLTTAQSFIFPNRDWNLEKDLITQSSFDDVLLNRQREKENQLGQLISNLKSQFRDTIYADVLAKAQLTLQNNWRVGAGEIKYEGLFPSYHYEWFNGFWSWDSWKHAVGLSHYDTDLAKKQVKLMFEFQNEDGFVADCVYRDTTIEAHNYRDTKPPLAAWAVLKVYEKDQDLAFLEYIYPKLTKYHSWWYQKRDHDQDGLCEYGSTDGSLLAAKWESGMDNAIRFDDAKVLKNEESAYSMNQESIDLNAYLYAEKLYLSQLAQLLDKQQERDRYEKEAALLKKRIQQQFYDEEDGWFYDTNLAGDTFIKGAGSEGWTALWAKAATPAQAETVKDKMMDPAKFFTQVPFQTMSADHPKFAPLKGYWRGPCWLDQAYFGVEGLRYYNFPAAADQATRQILAGANGILEKGVAIRENYHPLTGEGLHAQNFSWSAAHIIMLLVNE